MKKIFFATMLLCGTMGCTPKTSTSNIETSPKSIPTKTATAQRQTITLNEEFTSEIKAYRENDITPAVSGVRIDEIMVDVGDKVERGELLVKLDPTLYDQQMINVNKLRTDVERLKPVYEAGGISRQTYDDAQSAYELQLEVANNLKKHTELHSPIAGVVTSRNSEVGNLLNNSPILHIAQIDKLKVLVSISEQFFPNVSNGMDVDLTLDIYPDKLFKGHVTLIYPSLDAESRTFMVEVTLPNNEALLRPGMFARSQFNMGSREAIIVPDVAIQKQYGADENYVYIIKDNIAHRRVVKIGRQLGSSIEILSGIEAGEDVAITAFSRLGNGIEVNVK